MGGAVIAGFVLLPLVGMERSFFILAATYVVVALLSAMVFRPSRNMLLAAIAIVALAAFSFRFGLMREEFIPQVTAAFRLEGTRLVAYREGRTETAMYMEKDLWGEPEYFRLLTNSHSMSASTFPARRYMSLFADWPAMVKPEARSALLISYGVGVTAKALTSNPSYGSIDIVDISRDILELNRSVPVHPQHHPLDDPRVRVHIEDGRFFIGTTGETFDVITAEPPPPKSAGVVNLYSEEYFKLMRGRLNRGGVATYWLPVYQMTPRESKAIINAFCNAFDDCTLWSGSGLEWMLAGTNGITVKPGTDLNRLWRDPQSAYRLGAIAFDRPELIGTTFVADAAALHDFARNVPPVTDDFPLRLSWRDVKHLDPEYFEFMRANRAAARLARSQWASAFWPPDAKASIEKAEPLQRIVNDALLPNYGAAPIAPWSALEFALLHTPSRAVPLLLLESDARAVEIATAAQRKGIRDAEVDAIFAAKAISERDYAAADQLLAAAIQKRDEWRYVRMRIFERVMAGDLAAADTMARAARRRRDAVESGFWKWYEEAGKRRRGSDSVQ
jgi:spermidine synthase